MSTNYSLEFKNLQCIRDSRTLFSELNMTVLPNQALILEGDNGSGKTSLLRILCGIRSPDHGEVTWCQQPIKNSSSGFFEEMLYIGHLDGIKRDLTVEENLKVCMGLGKPSEIGISKALDQVGLYGYEDVRSQVLSAGQRRRVALASLLIRHAVLWVLDEPFTALDKTSRAVFENIMNQHVRQGGMIVVTSHHPVQLSAAEVITINLSEQ